ncbi:MAG: alpha/beta hydrolase [Acidobacteriota bacterium]|nr:alpha/beta hydrolase [Acidobacteriota bacterium]
MTDARREFVACPSPTGVVNGAGFHPCQGLWYTASRRTPKVGVIATHYGVDFSEHYLAEPLARRGVGFLGWNTRYRGNDGWFLLEHALVDIGAGVQWLRRSAGVEAVVLLGNCGGGSLMAAYQSQALGPTIEPSAGLSLPEALGDLLPGDLYVSLQAHPGRAEMLANWMDPSVTDETDPLSRDPALDMYDAGNGPPYDDAFVARYRAAQRARNDRITDWAETELDRLTAAGTFDRNVAVHRTWADLRFLDGALDPSERTVGRCLGGDPRRANAGPYGIASTCTLRTWLSMWSLRRSQCRGADHLGRIDLPALVLQSRADAGVFPSDATAIHDALGSSDKELQWMAGDHYLESPDGAREEAADRIADWLAARA